MHRVQLAGGQQRRAFDAVAVHSLVRMPAAQLDGARHRLQRTPGVAHPGGVVAVAPAAADALHQRRRHVHVGGETRLDLAAFLRDLGGFLKAFQRMIEPADRLVGAAEPVQAPGQQRRGADPARALQRIQRMGQGFAGQPGLVAGLRQRVAQLDPPFRPSGPIHLRQRGAPQLHGVVRAPLAKQVQHQQHGRAGSAGAVAAGLRERLRRARMPLAGHVVGRIARRLAGRKQRRHLAARVGCMGRRCGHLLGLSARQRPVAERG
ncbi:MAG: hypothetical protein QM750_25935 [Rubrivivax sp.]